MAYCVCGTSNECKGCDGTTQYYPPYPMFYQNSKTNGIITNCKSKDYEASKIQ